MKRVCIQSLTTHIGCQALKTQSFFERTRGLIRSPPSYVLLIDKCSSIHTFFMGYPLDVAFIADMSRVVETYRCVSPGKIICCRAQNRLPTRCMAVLERPACVSPWFCRGEEIRITTRPSKTEPLCAEHPKIRRNLQ